MKIDHFTFGSVRIDGQTYDRDVVIDRGEVHARSKKPSKRFRDSYGHTPLSAEEKIPWKCERLVVGTGAEGALPVMDAVVKEAEKRGVELVAVRTPDAIRVLGRKGPATNAILHLTC